MKTYYFNDIEVNIVAERYANNNTLAVRLVEVETGDPFAYITVNLNSASQTDKTAFVDDNNISGVGEWLIKNGIARPTGYRRQSGFCIYELYYFDF